MKLTAPLLSLLMVGTAGASFAGAQYQGPPPAQGQGYGQGAPGQGQGGWDAPPGDYRDVQRQGFHDGMDAAHRDFHEGRAPDPAQHREFRQPQVPPPDRHDYREAFRRGYSMAMHHMHDGGGPEGPR